MITDYDDLFERFSIMTIEGKISDDEALKLLEKRTSPDLLARLVDDIKKY